jgi:hypothetical protein
MEREREKETDSGLDTIERDGNRKTEAEDYTSRYTESEKEKKTFRETDRESDSDKET